jgi:hypothetical protein
VSSTTTTVTVTESTTLISQGVSAKTATTITLGSVQTSVALRASSLAAYAANGLPLDIKKGAFTAALPASSLSGLGLDASATLNVSLSPVGQSALPYSNLLAKDSFNASLADTFYRVGFSSGGSALASQPGFRVSVDLASKALTAAQKAQAIGVRVVDGAPVYIGGAFSGDKFEFIASGDGVYGVVLASDFKLVRLAIGQTSFSVNTAPKSSDVAPLIVDGYTMVPLRFIAEALDASVAWNGSTRTVTITQKTQTLTLTIGQASAGMPVAPQIVNDRTVVPVAYIARAFESTVNWYEETRTVEIVKITG